jgi:hypothetical protein
MKSIRDVLRTQSSRMGIQWAGVVCFLVLTIGMGSSRTLPSDAGGNEVPIGLEWRKQRYELADGETYALIGKITDLGCPDGRETDFGCGSPAFQIDYDAQVWLANKNQLAAKAGYPLVVGNFDISKFLGQRVRANFRAVQYIDSSGLLPQIRVRLVLLDAPVFEAVQPPSKGSGTKKGQQVR